jgi:hypothetical protein
MIKTWIAAVAGLLLAALVLVPLAAEAQRRIDPAIAKLPDGDGKIAVIELCAGACHPASRFVNMRQSRDQWHNTVMSMVARGAELFPQDVDTVTNYLGTYLSNTAAPPPQQQQGANH